MEQETTDTPALLGGVPTVTLDQMEANRWPILTEEDEKAVIEVMRSGNITTHPVARELESEYRTYFERQYALSHNNGTSALMAAFFAIDLQPGDEVIVPTATFWASVIPMLWLGAVPVFCECEEERLGLDPTDVEAKITDKTKAIVVVHLWGLPSKMTELQTVAAKYDLKIIEDASHAHGAKWRGKPCGALGDISVFSLQGDKLAPGGEGGVFLCDDEAFLDRAKCMGDMMRMLELKTPAMRFAGTTFGIKTRIAPVSAAIARVQLRRLAKRNAKRNESMAYLSEALEALGFHTYLGPEHVERVYFEFLVRHDEAAVGLPLDVLIEALVAEGCEAEWPRYPLLHQQPLFTEGTWQKIARLPEGLPVREYRLEDLPRTQHGNSLMFKLPSFPNAELELLDQYIAAFRKVVANAAAIRAVKC
jgi:dTDP-4-amino-4,6-dideoxygalactose transaminase